MSTSSIPSAIQGIVAQFTGCSATLNGAGGSVPAPVAGDQLKALLGGGTFGDVISAVNVQRFTVSGTYTPTTGMKYAIVEMVGGGGSGGGAAATTLVTQTSSGGAGGAGAYLRFLATAAQVGASVAVTVGAAGAAANGVAGNAGTATSFGALATCNGGNGGSVQGPTAGNTNAPGGTGGSATLTTGTLITSASGQNGERTTMNVAAGGMSISGGGGSSLLGNGAIREFLIGTQNFIGLVPTGFGSGSSGTGIAQLVSTARVSTAGGSGVVIVTEFI